MNKWFVLIFIAILLSVGVPVLGTWFVVFWRNRRRAWRLQEQEDELNFLQRKREEASKMNVEIERMANQDWNQNWKKEGDKIDTEEEEKLAEVRTLANSTHTDTKQISTPANQDRVLFAVGEDNSKTKVTIERGNKDETDSNARRRRS